MFITDVFVNFQMRSPIFYSKFGLMFAPYVVFSIYPTTPPQIKSENVYFSVKEKLWVISH